MVAMKYITLVNFNVENTLANGARGVSEIHTV